MESVKQDTRGTRPRSGSYGIEVANREALRGALAELEEFRGRCRTQHQAPVPSERQFRDVMGRFATGVSVVTSTYLGEPVGMTVQAIASVSLDPLLVAFFPAASSSSWPKIRESAKFCINFLPSSGAEIGKQFARSGTDKFAHVDWEFNQFQLPVLGAATSTISCNIQAAPAVGDHLFVVGHVMDVDTLSNDDPLLFYSGRFWEMGQQLVDGE